MGMRPRSSLTHAPLKGNMKHATAPTATPDDQTSLSGVGEAARRQLESGVAAALHHGCKGMYDFWCTKYRCIRVARNAVACSCAHSDQLQHALAPLRMVSGVPDGR
jgi:hypothetical protein